MKTNFSISTLVFWILNLCIGFIMSMIMQRMNIFTEPVLYDDFLKQDYFPALFALPWGTYVVITIGLLALAIFFWNKASIIWTEPNNNLGYFFLVSIPLQLITGGLLFIFMQVLSVQSFADFYEAAAYNLNLNVYLFVLVILFAINFACFFIIIAENKEKAAKLAKERPAEA